MPVKLLAIVISFFIFGFVVELIRREKLTFKYAFGWMLAAVLGLVFTIFDKLLFELSTWCGFVLPSNFIFFSLLGALILMSLMISIFLCQQNRRNDAMAQKISMLEYEIERLRKEKK